MSYVFDRVVDLLNRHDLPFLLIGGVAVGQYISTRMTLDLDLAMSEENARLALPLLRQQGFTTLSETDNFIRLNPPPGQSEITDILYLNAQTFALLWSARQMRSLAGRTVAVAAPEHLIRMKLHALKYGKADRIKKDVPDILDLMPLCGWTPEHPDFMDACKKHATDALYGMLKERWQTWMK